MNDGITISKRALLWTAAILAGLILFGAGYGAGRLTSPPGAGKLRLAAHPSGSASAATSTAAPRAAPASSVPPTTPAATPPAAPVSTAEILAPASVPPVVPECSLQLSYGADGNAGPLFCPNGGININAWEYFAAAHPLVMALGPNASPDQVSQAMCADLATAPIGSSTEEIAARYYGWRFGVDPTQGDWYSSCQSGG